MSTRRNKTDTPNLADLESANNPVDVPGVMPPPGVKARIRTQIDYDRQIDPDDVQTASYPDDLRELAGSEFDDNELPEPAPQDPYSEFVNTWRKFIGYPLKIVRLPDPADKRMPGNTYNKPCFELTMLSDTPFDPNNLIGMLQVINNNSGGVFRVFLTDEYGTPVPGARLDRLVIADPPKQFNQPDPRQFNPQGYNPFGEDPRYARREREREPLPPQKSETEQRIEKLQSDLFERVMMRALDPPPPPPAPDPLSTLSSEDRLALGLLQRGDILESAVNRIANLAQAPDRIAESTWKDKMADAAIGLVTNNPQVIATATDIISRTLVMITQALAPRNQQIASEPIPVNPVVHRPPAQRAAPQIQNAPPVHADVNTGLPETPQPEDDDLSPEETEIEIMEDLVKLLLTDKPLSFDDPVIVDLREAYPQQFAAILAGVAKTPSMMIIQYLCSKSQFCADMFNDSRQGPHLRARLEELKGLLNKPSQAPQVINAEPENETEE